MITRLTAKSVSTSTHRVICTRQTVGSIVLREGEYHGSVKLAEGHYTYTGRSIKEVLVGLLAAIHAITPEQLEARNREVRRRNWERRAARSTSNRDLEQALKRFFL
jgi:hypothetical protein